ncbi:MAG: glucokinase [Sphingomicrobium sp.]
MNLVVADIGGTHARFALARIEGSQVIELDDPVVLRTSAYTGIVPAWAEFASRIAAPLPRSAALAVAAPIDGSKIKMTNSGWVIRPALLDSELGLDRHLLINDFTAVGHAVAAAAVGQFAHIAGPDVPLPVDGAISIVGPGTGLGVALLLRGKAFGAARYHVQPSEGGHMDFAPIDAFDDALVARLRSGGRRLFVEQVVSGNGLVEITRTLAEMRAAPAEKLDPKLLWAAAIAREDAMASAALDRFCMSLGSVAGDVALAHGAHALVIAGGLGPRILDRLPGSGFAERFCAKSPYEALMAAIPVKLITHPQPGLLGAAAAFASWSATGFA